MKISFHGAAQEVTGSCTLVETAKIKFLVDCGMFQGQEFSSHRNWDDFAFDPKTIDYVFLTHAHADHCGRLAKLYKDGFRGRVFATGATRELAKLIMLDSAGIIKEEALQHREEPFFLSYHVDGVMNHFEDLEYHKIYTLPGGIKIKLNDAGHILGSSIFEIWITENKAQKPQKLVFSGDLGNSPAPIMHDPEFIEGADYVFMESTYGGRIHESSLMRRTTLTNVIKDAINNNGTLVIPSFALERTQELLYELNQIVEEHQLPYVPIYLDSPLAIKAISVYRKYSRLFDEESQLLLKKGDDLFDFAGLEYVKNFEQSRALDNSRESKVIIAGSGMCNGGRIPHHLSVFLPDSRNQVLIIAYQANGSLGRRLRDGEKIVTIENQKIKVRAKVTAIGSYSSHADQPKLLYWLKQISKPKPKKVFIMHGEGKANLMLADGVVQKLRLNYLIPEYGKTYDL